MKRKFTKLVISIIALMLLSGQVFSQTDISGKVLYHFKANKPIPSVDLNLINVDGNVVATTTTDLSGNYSFANIAFGTYTLEASTSISAGGVTMGDAFLMFLHLINFYNFTPIQELAADVDGDGTITWDDYWTVVIGWFIQGYPFPAGPWTFEGVTFTLDGTKTNVPTMGGSSSGDVNGTFVPSTRDLVAVQSIYTEKTVDNNFSVEIYANDVKEASAMGMVIEYPAAMININNITCTLGETNMAVENGQIRLNWINQSNSTTTLDPSAPVLVIHASTNNSYDGRDVRFVIDPESHFSNYKGEQIDTRYTLPLITMQGNLLSNNYPNPFSGSTNITYTLPADTKVNISLFNQQGQLVRILTDVAESAGTHNINFDSYGLDAGVYYYTLKTTGTVNINETKRMIITR